MTIPAASAVTAIPPADPASAAAHFGRLLTYETDCWDVHQALISGSPDFVLLQVNGTRQSFDDAHIPGAGHLHHSAIDEAALAAYPAGTVFVVYCSGPHCNGADRAAGRIAELGHAVKKMIGGIEGWKDEGFELTVSQCSTSSDRPR
jgi:rhodanese-related sulfurtransferase